jgi:ubiquinone/menaquinone biosynthesis C-methylase UbiE
LALALIVTLTLATANGARGQDVPPEINKAFRNPNVAEYIKRFETESREIYAQREAIAQAVGLKPGMAVADIGAGTGLFTRLFADRVGPEGKVYAVDIAVPFLKHIAAEAKKRGQTQIQTIEGSQESTNLPAGSVDAAFLCDVYHHLEQHPRVLASIHSALRPGGRLVVIEFDRREGISSDFIMKHVRAGKAQFLSEITAAGFEPIKTPDPPRFKENFFAEFRRVERVKAAP